MRKLKRKLERFQPWDWKRLRERDSQALLARCLRGSWSRTPCPFSTGKCPAPGSLELWNQQAAINTYAQAQLALWDLYSCTVMPSDISFNTLRYTISQPQCEHNEYTCSSETIRYVCLYQHVNTVIICVQSFVTVVAHCTKTKKNEPSKDKKDLFWAKSIILERKQTEKTGWEKRYRVHRSHN